MPGADAFRIRLVAIDDDPASLALIEAALRTERDLDVLTTTNPGQGVEIILRNRAQIALIDLMMPGVGGLELLERIAAASPDTDVILVTGHYSAESAVRAIQKGATDYWTKPISVALLRERVGKLIEQCRQRHAASLLDGEVLRANQFEGIVGRSPLMLDVFRRIRRIAPHFRTALVTGATGTGKELVAAALHRLSPVAQNRLAVCNCSAVVETLFESELFGHVKGAFTGAGQDKLGLFEYANGGTVFLDEIGDMPLDTQSKLLRVLENGEVQRVGSPAVRRVDVRVVAATNRDLRDMMARNQFREDLFYRLSMVEIKLPKLCERPEDIPLLQRYFLEQFSAEYGKAIRGLTPRAQLLLSRHSWPGNVRELKSVLGSACMLAEGGLLDIQDFPEHLRRAQEDAGDEDLLTLEEVGRRHVRRVLERLGGNKARAARILGINRTTIYRILGEDAAESSAPLEPTDAL
jgi:DNA-binding NtrC family response regulator